MVVGKMVHLNSNRESVTGRLWPLVVIFRDLLFVSRSYLVSVGCFREFALDPVLLSPSNVILLWFQGQTVDFARGMTVSL